MLALVAAAHAPHVELAEVPDLAPPLPDEALVDVRAFSLNRGEVRALAEAEPGRPHGWDVAGVVARAAADGSGPPEGTRVVGLKHPPGGWAQRAAIRTELLAPLPDAVSFEQAATLPVAGLTALRALEVAGYVLGKHVAITGASGGVGRFAIQLAHDGGAHVTAVARRQEGLEELGAHAVVDRLDPEGDGPLYDAILDGVGGPVLGDAIQRLAPGGVAVSYASTIPEPVRYPTRSLFGRAPRASVRGLFLFDELAHTRTGAADLRRLAERIAIGRLDVTPDLLASWREAPRAVQALLDGEVRGKAVLTVD
ncbi:MAG TPA: zinc-binding dehydrogenase [Baekduia sp.]|uniref:zinc-binding dehydrogenase n=1 Tax=Baekduia sp. TaxID=2600305 RepID=UPI002D78BF6A|nr:zinc-binding dehydrogenase [Baekduia sp.]HET6507475.1 zinc-binding dehydrogenase [Baekduia sp.]